LIGLLRVHIIRSDWGGPGHLELKLGVGWSTANDKAEDEEVVHSPRPDPEIIDSGQKHPVKISSVGICEDSRERFVVIEYFNPGREGLPLCVPDGAVDPLERLNDKIDEGTALALPEFLKFVGRELFLV